MISRSVVAAFVTLLAVPLVAVAGSSAAAPGPCGSVSARPWCDRDLSPDKRARLLLKAMTLDEKIGMMAGDDALGPLQTQTNPDAHEGTVQGIARLGVPTVLMAGGGPAGIRQGEGTALPAPISLGATFSRTDAARWGRLVGDEGRRRGNDVILGPALDIMRLPNAGRAYEAYGEDPYLTGELGVPWIKAAQKRGVMAMVKHYPANNQETDRYLMNAVVGTRAMREIYLPPFEKAIRQGDAAAVMCGYNKVNGTPSCANHTFLGKVLRGSWGFDGFVASDWLVGAKNTVASVRGGMDVEMPVGLVYSRDRLNDALRDKRITVKQIDARVRNYLRTLFAHGVFDRRRYADQPQTINVAANNNTARSLAENGITLLKNNGVLPLRGNTSLAVIGSAANEYVSGIGSSQVTPRNPITVLAGLRARAGGAVTYADGSDLGQAAAAARGAQVAVVVVADQREEAADLKCLKLTCGAPDRGDQDALVRAVTAANPNTVVLLQTGGPVLTPWRSQAAAVVEAWYPGERGGTAVARVLYGDAEPGGRLPVTFPVKDVKAAKGGTVRYAEGIQVGYRRYNARKAPVAYPFGHGLTYTTFKYGGIKVKGDKVQVTVTNTGSRVGTAVPQLYLTFPKGAGEPPRQLKGFAKIKLKPGQTRRVTFTLDKRAFSVWKGGWKSPRGCYTVEVGASSRALPLSARLCR
ncbi:beta-glucosidase [Actinocorallia sp. A-T 12471]|uniref:beta-glucosidase n=1 Tax=Actinocorallia sp. A-T 12471 TaxID=3089813 RepID=UPI0029CDDDBE|nr:glycoside hydrolase family 3 C-terminal domain-containing protein [Actinocorallia sp. A-T 12471]MDX6743768.1 glycoside hydrolase family 3 C-terminal domain-containing protein [Actinocorallia sp. A-T 12471]